MPAILYEVIVTDDGSDDRTKELICQQYDWVQWVQGPGKGPAANRNNGAAIASGDWLVFTDDDCLPKKDWLAQLAASAAGHPDCLAIEGAILPDDWELLQKDMAECPVNQFGNCFWSANIMIHKTLFQKIAGFDEQFRIAAQEDQDIKKRIEQHTQILFNKEAIVLHPVRIGKLSSKMRNINRSIDNYMKYALKYESDYRAILRRESQLHLRVTLKSLQKRHFKTSLLHLLYFLKLGKKWMFRETRNQTF